MTAWPPLLVFTIRTFFLLPAPLAAAMAVMMKFEEERDGLIGFEEREREEDVEEKRREDMGDKWVMRGEEQERLGRRRETAAVEAETEVAMRIEMDE